RRIRRKRVLESGIGGRECRLLAGIAAQRDCPPNPASLQGEGEADGETLAECAKTVAAQKSASTTEIGRDADEDLFRTGQPGARLDVRDHPAGVVAAVERFQTI